MDFTAIDRVLVAGASGATGRELLRLLRGTDIEVTALTSSPAKGSTLDVMGADRVVVGNLLNRRDARRAVDDVDAVCCAVGSSPGRSLFFGDLVDGEGAINLVDAAVAAECSAFVLASSIGVGDSASGMPTPFRLLIKRIIDAKGKAERHLRESGLSYTIVRPGGLTNDPATGDVVCGEGGPTVSGSIPRADVARLMIAALATPDGRNRTLEIVARSQLRGRTRGVVEIDWQLPPGIDGETF